jgi:hypothetical protein
MNPVVHFELPAEDTKRIAEFYAKVFGWKTKQFGADMGNYVMAYTTETDEKGMTKKPNEINGGFYQKSKPEQVTNIVIQVEDIRAAMRKVEAEGGTVIGGMTKAGEPDVVKGVGEFISIKDTEGNLVSIMQAAAK